MLIKLHDTPGQYVFEVHVGQDGQLGQLEVNYWEANAAMRSAGLTDDDWSNDKTQPDLIKRVAAAVRPTLRPRAIVEQMTDEAVFTKINQAGHLHVAAEQRLGEAPEPSPTSRRPMELSSSPGA